MGKDNWAHSTWPCGLELGLRSGSLSEDVFEQTKGKYFKWSGRSKMECAALWGSEHSAIEGNPAEWDEGEHLSSEH